MAAKRTCNLSGWMEGGLEHAPWFDNKCKCSLDYLMGNVLCFNPSMKFTEVSAEYNLLYMQWPWLTAANTVLNFCTYNTFRPHISFNAFNIVFPLCIGILFGIPGEAEGVPLFHSLWLTCSHVDVLSSHAGYLRRAECIYINLIWAAGAFWCAQILEFSLLLLPLFGEGMRLRQVTTPVQRIAAPLGQRKKTLMRRKSTKERVNTKMWRERPLGRSSCLKKLWMWRASRKWKVQKSRTQEGGW